MFISEINGENAGASVVTPMPNVTPMPQPAEPTVKAEPINEPLEINAFQAPAEDISSAPEKPNFDMLLKANDNTVEEPEEIEEPLEEKPSFGGFSFDNINVEEPAAPEKPDLIAPMEIEEPIQPTPSFTTPFAPEPIEETPTPVFNSTPSVESLGEFTPAPSPVPNVQPEVVSTPAVEAQTNSMAGLRTAINTLRQAVDTIEKYGFRIESDELDLENDYQVIITISKENV